MLQIYYIHRKIQTCHGNHAKQLTCRNNLIPTISHLYIFSHHSIAMIKYYQFLSHPSNHTQSAMCNGCTKKSFQIELNAPSNLINQTTNYCLLSNDVLVLQY